MVNRTLFLLIFITISTLFSYANTLKSMTLKHNSVELHFSKLLQKEDLRTEVIAQKKLTRYIFDFKNCTLAKGVKSIKSNNKIVTSIRVGQYKSNTVRLVLDSKRPFRLKYYQKSKPIFYIRLPLKHEIQSEKKESAKQLFTKILKEKKESIAAVPLIKPSLKLRHNYKIVIDPGHGGRDPGTMWRGYKERNIVFQIAKRVARELRTLGFQVLMTRTNNKRYVKLSSRTRYANKKGADVFVSIHANSIEKQSRINIARGVETYFLMPARDARAKRVAARENRDMLKGEDLATRRMFINALFTGPKIELSKRLAIDVQKNVIQNLRSSYTNIKNGGARGAPYYVLVGAQMPAILIEVGYLSNPVERARLADPSYQEKLADGIVRGIINYLKNREREID